MILPGTSQILRHPWRTWLISGVILATLSALALGYTAANLPPRSMQARVHSGLDFESPPVYVGHDARLDPGALAILAGLNPADPFVVQWDGYFVIDDPGRYRLRIRSDDGAAVWVDDQVVVDQLTGGGEQYAIEVISLERGLHKVRIRYVQRGARTIFRLAWATPLWREHYGPVYAIPESDPPPNGREVLYALQILRAVALSWSLWLIAGFALGLTFVMSRVAGDALWSTLRWQDVAPFALIAIALLFLNIDAGTLPWRGWVPDELNPKDVDSAARLRLTGGWFHFYPAFHVGLLVAVASPIFALAEWRWISFEDPAVSVMLHALIRAVTTVMAVLTLVAVALLANLGLGRTRTFAPYVLLGTPVFVFYGQTGNVDVPHIFWCTLAALAFIRALSERTLASHAWLGALVAAAITTKDQAYGFFPGVAVVLLWATWKHTPRAASVPRRLWLSLTDRRIWVGLLAFLAMYTLLLGVLVNPSGVRAHFALITGAGSEPFRMFPPTVSGHMVLVASTLRLLWLTIGPLSSVAAIAGLAAAVANPSHYRKVLPLLAMPISYMVTLIGVVGYVYDRFLLGFVVVAAVFAAIGFEVGLGLVRSARLRTAIATIALAIVLYPGASLSLRLATDSRTEVERWLAAHAEDDPFVLGVGDRMYLPNLYPYRHAFERRAAVDEILARDADLVIINEDWADRRRRRDPTELQRQLRHAGYEEAVLSRGWPEEPGPWVLLDGTLAIDPVLSNVRKASPPLSVWRKVRSEK
jgi:hypothetical protein